MTKLHRTLFSHQMKLTIIYALIGLLASLGSTHARTWTSADGTKTFEGTLKSYDAETQSVTVLINGNAMTFSTDKLSQEDITFLEEQKDAEPEAAPAEKASESVIGAKVAGAKLHRLNGKRFKKAELEKAPEFYLLYYSASW